MFRGQFTYSIDSKGRIAIPAKLRKHISAEASDTFVMTRGLSNCIDLYPLDEWQKIEQTLLDLNSFQPDDARFIRMFVQFAAEDGALLRSTAAFGQRPYSGGRYPFPLGDCSWPHWFHWPNDAGYPFVGKTVTAAQRSWPGERCENW